MGSGLAAASVLMPKGDLGGSAAELLGALLGGYIGGRAADILDPPLTPNHRAVAHGGLAVAGLVKLARAGLVSSCRDNASSCQARSLEFGRSEAEKEQDRSHELLWRFAAGLLIGVIAGYSSHLLLDAGTKRGLPLLGVRLV